MKKLSLVVLALAVAGCATIPGKTRSEQTNRIDELLNRTLTDLAQQHPNSTQEIDKSVGYVVMDNKITKVPVFGVGAGFGVAIDNHTKSQTYLRMSRFDIGAGWGARSVRPVIIFHDDQKFRQFINGAFDATVGAEASAKVGDKGVAGGAGTNDVPTKDKGYKIYFLTDAGVSATVSLGLIRVKPVKLRKS